MELKRASGILLHLSSLPGSEGIGTLGDEAFEFIDFLEKSNQSYWQILPIGPVSPGQGYSPYASTSTFAGNTMFISTDKLRTEKWCRELPEKISSQEEHFINFDKLFAKKNSILKKYAQIFFRFSDETEKDEFDKFCKEHEMWLNDFALFSALSENFYTHCWNEWEKNISIRKPEAIEKWEKSLTGEIKEHKFLQYIFFKQFCEVKKYAEKKSILIIGDIPIYLTLDSSEAWSNPEIFQLNKTTFKPELVSGVPPDYFSETGQRWGNPLYKWFDSKNKLNNDVIQWWSKRLKHILKYIDILRIDHFRAFESYWAIPEEEETAVKGEWLPGPGREFFTEIKSILGELPLIAEDLGIITPEVEKLRDDLNLPGMRILQFAFDHNNKNTYLPHNITNPNCILYTGTHDNDTTNGWFYGSELNDDTRNYILEYLGSDTIDNFHIQLIKQAFRSIANTVIIPAQDLIGYGPEFKMNTPGTSSGNWTWKLTHEELNIHIANELKRMCHIYSRYPENDTK